MPGDDQVLDYLGQPQPTARKAISLSEAGGGGAVTAPVTPSVGERQALARNLTFEPGSSPTGSLGQRILQGAGVGKDVLGLANDLMGLAPDAATRGATGGVSLSDTLRGAATEGASESAATSAGGSLLESMPDVGQALPYVGAAISAARDVMSGKSDVIKGADVGLDVAGAALAPWTFGVSIPAAEATKRIIDDFSGKADPTRLALDLFPGGMLVNTITDLFGGGPSQYSAKRQSAEALAKAGVSELGRVESGAGSDPASALAALQTTATDRGAVRSAVWLPSDAAASLGLPAKTDKGLAGYEWSELSPAQFSRLLAYFAADPARLGSGGAPGAQGGVTGSGDVARLPQGQAEGIAAQAAEQARTLIRRAIAAQGTSAQTTATGGSDSAPPAAVSPTGPAGALGFARDLLQEG